MHKNHMEEEWGLLVNMLIPGHLESKLAGVRG